MKRFGLLFILMLALVGCKSDPKKQILGKWTAVDGSGTVEFLQTGDFIAAGKGMPALGKTTWEYVDDKHIRVILHIPVPKMPPQPAGRPQINLPPSTDIPMMMDMKLENDQLTFGASNGKATIFKRES